MVHDPCLKLRLFCHSKNTYEFVWCLQNWKRIAPALLNRQDPLLVLAFLEICRLLNGASHSMLTDLLKVNQPMESKLAVKLRQLGWIRSARARAARGSMEILTPRGLRFLKAVEEQIRK
jgi:hypothetical protein